ncbi:hypothetical protein QBC35DRAFT_510013 [Podospora australis]|uniref:Zn(2)-C6 fungal-type domain-containing protein n=1 Tax=Podospora australis TaxID=1536484 RepID=A0AAN6WHY5_9PEZI|nr:hypothetical protein QBC35DRAFT_510013 [Podospora australis]
MPPVSATTIPNSEACSPAPYGKACVGCSRAKCKCFYRVGGLDCERCYRLGKPCEPSVAVRKRKAKTPPPLQPPPNTRLEDKLDDLVSILRSQATANQCHQMPSLPGQQPASSTTHSMPSELSTTSSSLATRILPNVVVDTTEDYIDILSPESPRSNEPLLPVLADVSARFHQITDAAQEKQLDWLRDEFLPVFPFVYIPPNKTVAELRSSKPFLWLVIMALTSKVADQQFSLEETIWTVITQRIVAEHLADLDLLQGLICFGAWSHVFKKQKPFMGMLCQLCTSLASELGIHRAIPADPQWQSRGGEPPLAQPDSRPSRALEERRTILSVYHLSSATWSGYRKTEPICWTPYMSECLRILTEESETQFDILLTAEIKCQLIANQLLSPSSEETGHGSEGFIKPSHMLILALLAQLDDLQRSLPPCIQESRIAQLYILSTQITVYSSLLASHPYASQTERSRGVDPTCLAYTRHLQSLETTLNTAEKMVTLFFEPSPPDSIPTWWPAISVDVFAKLTHCMVIILKLTMLINEPGWDVQEVKRRADVFALLDQAASIVDRTPAALGMVDATHGDRHSLFFKAGHLFRAIKLLFNREVQGQQQQANGNGMVSYGGSSSGKVMGGVDASNSEMGAYQNNAGDMNFVALDDDFLNELGNEPWMADLLGTTWGFWGSEFSM